MPSGSADFFFNDTATTEIYTLSLHAAPPPQPQTEPKPKPQPKPKPKPQPEPEPQPKPKPEPEPQPKPKPKPEPKPQPKPEPTGHYESRESWSQSNVQMAVTAPRSTNTRPHGSSVEPRLLLRYAVSSPVSNTFVASSST